MKCHTLFNDGRHRFLMFGRDPERADNMIDTNQFAIQVEDEVVLLDPGGLEAFPSMMAAATEQFPLHDIRHIVFSHQDPDVASGLAVWRQVCRPDVKIHISWMWTGFVAHYDHAAKLTPIKDEGGDITIKGHALRLVPAHFLHSPGNYSVWDPTSRILFTGDIGACVPVKGDELYLDDFPRNAHRLEGFHRRWMGSVPARDAWLRRVRNLPLTMMAPQHGLILKEPEAHQFFDWFQGLEIGQGIDLG